MVWLFPLFRMTKILIRNNGFILFMSSEIELPSCILVQLDLKILKAADHPNRAGTVAGIPQRLFQQTET